MGKWDGIREAQWTSGYLRSLSLSRLIFYVVSILSACMYVFSVSGANIGQKIALGPLEQVVVSHHINTGN